MNWTSKMDRTYWHKQTKDEPLSPDLLWSKPENKSQAGKLLVIGGNLHGFAAPAQAYQESLQAGIGTVRVLLPDALQKIVGGHFEAADYAPSTPSGSFSRKSLGELVAHAAWADAVLLAGELGRNSETAILLESFAQKSQGSLIITRDAIDYFHAVPFTVLKRPDTTLVLSFAQLQKLAVAAKFPRAFTFSMDLLNLIDALHDFTSTYPVHIVVKHLETMLVASGGEVSTTKLVEDKEIWRVETAAHVSVWWLQHHVKPFEAITIALLPGRL